MNRTTNIPGRSRLVWWVVLLACSIAGSSHAEEESWEAFDHFRTRFPLVGSHERVMCESCHGGGIFEGTPTRCALCHDGSGTRAQTFKDIGHIRSTDDCDDCHLMVAWVPSRIDHGAVRGGCFTCHNGADARGKHSGHILSSNDCELCHRTSTWLGARFNHSGISTGCVSCHNGFDAEGKNDGHVTSSDDCEDCHRTTTWQGARFSHSGISAGCVTCHNGIDARGKHDEHISSSDDCELCHNTRNWEDATFDHANITQPCTNCHAGDVPSNHFSSPSRDCSDCHDTNNWRTVRFNHPPGGYPGDHAGNPDCVRCHTLNNEMIIWQRPDLESFCAGCHASDFEQDEHKQDAQGNRNTVVGLKDCAGSCHVEKPRSGEHRASAREW